MRREKSSKCWMIGRCKAQAIFAIAAKEPLDGRIAEAAVAVVDDEQAIANLVSHSVAAALIGVELGFGVHLLGRMRAGADRMQARVSKTGAIAAVPEPQTAGILYWRHNE